MPDYPLFIPNTPKHCSNKETNRLTREAICTALVLLILEQPFEKITVTDIVRRAGVSRTAYYSNYSSKQDILIELVDSLILEINQGLLPYTNEQNGKAKEPEKFITVLFQILLKQRDIYQTLLDASFQHIILERLTETLQSNILNRTEENLYRATFNAGALYNIFTRWMQVGSHTPIEEMTQICLKIYYMPMSE